MSTELIALRPVLYLAHQYNAGDRLPVNNPGMTEAWLKAGSAAWKGQETGTVLKAVPVTAMPGQVGMASDGTNDSLAGIIPATPERKKAVSRKRNKGTVDGL